MNVIFLDFDGVLNTAHYMANEDIEKRIKILADICHEYNAKVVIEASIKEAIDEETMETFNEWIEFVFNCFKKYKIECIGRTPTVKKGKYEIWKEDEIILYLKKHPEIEHYCVIDDDDTKNIYHWYASDLDKVRNHLVETVFYSKDGKEEGLLLKHKEEVGKRLQEENEIRLLLKNNKE